MRSIMKIAFAALCIALAAGTVSSQGLDTLRIKAEADSLRTSARSMSRVGELEAAMYLCQAALAKYAQINDKVGESLALDGIAKIYFKMRNYSAAKKYFEERLNLERTLGDKKRLGEALGNAGWTCKQLHEKGNATNYLHESLEIAQEIGESQNTAFSLDNLAILHAEYAEFDSALFYYKQSLKLFEDKGSKSDEAGTLNGIGLVYYSISNYSKALDSFGKSQKIYSDLNDQKHLSYIFGNIGGVYMKLGDLLKSLEYFQKSYDISLQLFDSTRASNALGNIGTINFINNQYPDALLNYQDALKIQERIGDKKVISSTYDNIGMVYLKMSKHELAFKNFGQSLTLTKSLGFKDVEGKTLSDLGQYYMDLRKFKESEENIKMALSIACESGMLDEVRNRNIVLAECYRAQGLDSIAIVYYSKAIETADNIRGKLHVESFKSNYTAQISQDYENVVLLLIKSEQPVQAFHYAERGKARSFLDLLASAPVKVGKPEHQDFLAKDGEHQKQQQQLDEQIAQAGEDTAKAAALRGKLSQEWETALSAIEQTRKSEPELASLVSVDALTLPEVQKLLDKNAALLEYFLTKDKTLLWLVTHNNAEVFQVNIGGDSLKSLVMAYRKAIEKGADVTAQSQQLYDLLIAPAQDKMAADNLVIVPHGILHYLPYGALQNPKGDYLIDKYQISYLPSASVLKYLAPKRRPKGEKVLALGNPATDRKDFDPIPMTEAEVNGIGRLYRHSRVLTGPQATEEEFRKLAPDYDVLHLACHGDLNAAYPLFSCLLLTPDSAQDGELGVHEVFNMDLNASLVVLSGCQTGLGHLTNGDEVVGLSRAFIYAGTPSIVSSLWMVEDQSTAYLMERFYQHLKNKNKAEALRLAQLDARKRYPSTRSWASFVLIGDSM